MSDNVSREAVIEAILATCSRKDASAQGCCLECFEAIHAIRALPNSIPAKGGEVCQRCKGSGQVERPSFCDPTKSVEQSCHICKGSGNLPSDERAWGRARVKVRFKPDEYGFDELVIEGVTSIHFERMDRGVMWCAVYDANGNTHTIHFNANKGAMLGTYESDAPKVQP